MSVYVSVQFYLKSSGLTGIIPQMMGCFAHRRVSFFKARLLMLVNRAVLSKLL